MVISIFLVVSHICWVDIFESFFVTKDLHWRRSVVFICIFCLLILGPVHGDKADTGSNLTRVAGQVAKKVWSTTASWTNCSVGNLSRRSTVVILNRFFTEATRQELVHVSGIEGASSQRNVSCVLENHLRLRRPKGCIIIRHVSQRHAFL